MENIDPYRYMNNMVQEGQDDYVYNNICEMLKFGFVEEYYNQDVIDKSKEFISKKILDLTKLKDSLNINTQQKIFTTIGHNLDLLTIGTVSLDYRSVHHEISNTVVNSLNMMEQSIMLLNNIEQQGIDYGRQKNNRE